MSIQVLNWAWSIKGLPPAQRLMLLALADWSGDEWTCYPGHDKIAGRVEVSRRTVVRFMSDLTERGLISSERRFRKNGTRTSNLYTLNPGDKIGT